MDSNEKIINLRLISYDDGIQPYYIELNGIRVPIRFSHHASKVELFAIISMCSDLYVNLNELHALAISNKIFETDFGNDVKSDIEEAFEKIEERKKLFKTILEK